MLGAKKPPSGARRLLEGIESARIGLKQLERPIHTSYDCPKRQRSICISPWPRDYDNSIASKRSGARGATSRCSGARCTMSNDNLSYDNFWHIGQLHPL